MSERRDKRPILRWRGILEEATFRQRIMVFASLVILVIALAFTQLGFALLKLSVLPTTYVVTLFVPISLAALLLGALPGAAMGLIAGLMLSLHAWAQPLDFFETIVVTPLPICVIFLVCGMLLGVLFALVLRHGAQGMRAAMGMALACAAVSLLFSVAFFLHATVRVTLDYVSVAVDEASRASSEVPASDMEYLVNLVSSIGDPISQALVDAAIMALACLFTRWLMRTLGLDSDDRPLRVTFSGWLLAAVLIGFMLTITAGYTVVTESEKQLTEKDMAEEFEYLNTQRRAQTQWGWVYSQLSSEGGGTTDNTLSLSEHFDVRHLLDGYEMELDGTVIIAYGSDLAATVLATDDPEIEVGSHLGDVLERETLEAVVEALNDGQMHVTVYGHDDNRQDFGLSALEMGYLSARSYGGDASPAGSYIFIMIKPASMVFADRNQVVLWVTVSTAVLLTLLYFMISHLLNHVVLAPVKLVNEELGAICAGKLDTVVDARGSREFMGLSQGINVTVDALKDWIAEAERRIERELATARAIQSSALPSLFPPFPEIGEFDLFASMDPAREVGGDFYDFFLLEDGVLAFLIADVSGKGIPGALFMMEAKAELDNYMQAGSDLAEAVRLVNARLCEGNDAGMFVTVWAATLDYRRGLLTYVNAGHNPPLLRHDGAWRWLNERSGLFLGTFETAKYRSFQLELTPGDELLLYTDGVNEAFSKTGEEYGNARLDEFLAAHVGLGPQELVEALGASVAAWSEGAEQSDDITMLALEYHPET